MVLLGMGSSELSEDVSDSVACLGCFEDSSEDLSLFLGDRSPTTMMLPFFAGVCFLFCGFSAK